MWDQITTNLFSCLSEKELTWMTTPYHLVTAMRRVCTDLKVNINQQGLDVPLGDERQVLALQEERIFVREVFLEGDGAPFCFARAAVPLLTYQKYKKQLDALGEKFLGDAFLYTQVGTLRSPFEYAVMDATHPYFLKCAVAPHQKLGARRSIFYMAGEYPLLITEVFLPPIPLYQPE